MKIINARSWLIVKPDNDVTLTKSRSSCRTVLLKRYDQDSAFNRKIVEAHDPPRQRHVLSRHPYVTSANSAVTNQATRDKLGCINRSSKTDSLCRPYHCGVDTDDFSPRINQRTARVSRIERRIRLDHCIHQTARLGPQRTSKRADHACSHSVLKAVGISDGQH